MKSWKRSGVTYVILFLVLIVLAACGASESFDEGFDGFAAAESSVEREAFPAEPTAFDTAGESTDFNQVSVQERLIIRNGRIDVIVDDTEESLDIISRLVEDTGGWVVNSNVYGGDGPKSGAITVRVPADQFDAILESVRDLSIEVQSESTDSQDVTEEYVDLSARLDSLEATAARVRQFLDQARNVEEALEVNRELSRLEGEIESLKGRIQFLERSAAFSSLTIQLTPDALSGPIEVAGWRPQGVARDAIEALITALQSVGTLLIWALTFCLPLGLLLGIPLYLVYRFGYRRWRDRREVGRASPPDESADRDESGNSE